MVVFPGCWFGMSVGSVVKFADCQLGPCEEFAEEAMFPVSALRNSM